MKQILLTLIVTAVATTGCDQQRAVPPAAAPPAATAVGANQMRGRVLETMNSGGYTYVHLDTASGQRWAAIPQTTAVKKDATVTVDIQMTLDGFESKSLNRKFDKIVFGALADGAGLSEAAMPAGHPNVGEKLGGAADHMRAPAADVRVERAAGGKTVAEVWAEKSALSGKSVVVRGKVVKSLNGIMGSNWLHIQDGSASGETGDLTVTTNGTAAVGDVVTVRGVVQADKDFGSGYRYAVIVENATITK